MNKLEACGMDFVYFNKDGEKYERHFNADEALSLAWSIFSCAGPIGVFKWFMGKKKKRKKYYTIR